MAQALGLGRAVTRTRRLGTPINKPSICLFCSLSLSSLPPRLSSSADLFRSRRKATVPQRRQSTAASPPVNSPSDSNPREALRRALLDLESHAPNHVNLPRLHLALRNLSQPAGHESIRVAFLGTSAPSSTSLPSSAAAADSPPNQSGTAKQLLRLALADPLKPAQTWEGELEAHDTAARPLVVRVVAPGREGEGEGEGEEPRLRAVVSEHVIPELRASSPLLRDTRENGGGSSLDVLVAEVGAGALAAAAATAGNDGPRAVEDALLVPTIDVASTTAGHVAPVGTPVHMALLVADGVQGAAEILSLPVPLGNGDVVTAAVNFGGRLAEADMAGCPLVRVNVDAGRRGLALFRENVANAMKYEALWSEANVGRVTEWLRGSVLAGGEGATKAPVRNLIGSLLRSARASVQERQAMDLAAEPKTKVAPGSIAHLDQALAEWAQNAHEELQQQLDAAFAGKAWKKLGWWKLFWHADDVGIVTSEMVALRFLPEAEKGIIYLAGRIQEAGAVEGQSGHPLYSGPALTRTGAGTHRQDEVAPLTIAKWPTHIPFTRTYLQEKTVPALQALAQRLVIQAASLAGLSSALAGLSYLSALGAYECGAIAALGIVLSLRRLQRKWDAAREYWEGEVREEGRKAIRASEASVARVLDEASKPRSDDDRAADLEELRKAEEIIERAEDALARMK